MKKQLIFAALGAIFLASCADTWDREYSGVNPQKEGYEYLAEYLPLKEYVDRAKYPNFKLGIATTASEYTKQQLVYALVNSNADETVAGNAMKMASCVDDKGNMSFDNAVAFVNAATDAGLNVYGHTLAWHAQQPNKYLNSLLADKKVEVAARAVEVRNNPLLSRAANLEAMLDLDFEDGQPFFNGWGNNSTRVVEDGALKISNPSAVNPWEAQMAHDFTEPLEVGTSYRLEFKIKGSGSGTLGAGFQNPSNYSSCGDYEAVAFDTEWKNVSITTKCNAEEGKRLIFSFGAFAGDIYIDDFKFSKEVPIETEVIMSADFNDDNPVFNGWGNNSTRVVENGVLKVTNPSAVNPWEAQMAYDVNEPFKVGETYYIKFKIKGSAAGQMSAGFQITSNYASAGEFGNIDFTTEWQEVELSCNCNGEEATRLIFSFGAFAGDIFIDDFEFSIEVKGGGEVPVSVMSTNFDDGNSPFGGWGNNSTRVVENGVLKVTNPSAVNPWEAQLAYDVNEPFVVDQTYKMKFKVKGSAAGQISAGFQITSNYSSAGEFGAVDFTTDWQEVELTCTCNAEGATRLIFSFGAFAGDIYIDDFEFYYIVYGNSIPLTPEEKKEVLTVAMDRWIGGMMQAMEGKVYAWDAVNEPISGTDSDGDGFYELWSANNGDASNNFYWQDYLGSEDYVRIVVAKAREHYQGSEPLKLFVNDYNLESDWDDNKKLKSLIHWINVWEADEVTKIDGIGSQMHISCYADQAIQAKKEEHVVKMLELLAETGKLIRISELDMGYVDETGNPVKTTDMTEAQHKAMAEFYHFIISKYLELIPKEQQWGICQWCITDSPAGSGWRGNEPVGLWDSHYNRKHTYAGWADGLSGN